MSLLKKIIQGGAGLLITAIVISGCEKMDRPALGTYPTDSNPPGGPVKFYTAFDGINADSIRAMYASTDSVTSYVDGGSGKAIQFNPVLKPDGSTNVYSFLVYPSANDFAATASSFTVSFWLNCPLAKKDNINAGGILALSSTSSFWGNITVYTDHPGGPSDSMVLKFHFANGSGDNWDFANYTGPKMIPKIYDGNWHQIVFTYDAPSSTGTLYKDGVQFDQKTNETIKFDGNASNLVVGGFEQAAGIQGKYSDNTWMNGWPGALDLLKLSTVAWSAGDVAANYANKQ